METPRFNSKELTILGEIIISLEKSINDLKEKEITETDLENLKEKVFDLITDFIATGNPRFEKETFSIGLNNLRKSIKSILK